MKIKIIISKNVVVYSGYVKGMTSAAQQISSSILHV